MIVIKMINTSVTDSSYVNTQLESADLTNHVHILYECNEKGLKTMRSIKCHTLVINLSNLGEDSIDMMDDIIMDIIESPYTPVIRVPQDESVLSEFVDMADAFGLAYIDYDSMSLKSEPKLDNILDYIIINEIFNGVENKSNMFSPLDYTTRIIIDDNKVIIDGKECDLVRFKFSTLWSLRPQIDYEILLNVPTVFTRYISTPLPFILNDNVQEIVENVDEYKQAVFEKFVALTPRDLLQFPDEVRDIIVKGNYIPLEKLKEIEATK